LTKQPSDPPYWKLPTPYGYAAAIDGFGTVAAPLLAGFAFVLIGLTVSLKGDSPVRCPGVATAFLALSALLLLAAVQCSMWARQYTVTPEEMLAWWPEADATRRADLRETQWRYQRLAQGWLFGSRTAYNAGILALLLGVLVILIPKYWTGSRIAAVTLVGAGFLIELLWTVGGLQRLPLVGRAFRRPDQMSIQVPPLSPPPGA
jgi:hypothetical protein